MRFITNKNTNFYYDEESQTANEFIQDTYATKANSILWWFNHEKQNWENDLIDTNCIEFIQKFLPDKKPSYVSNVYKKVRAFATETPETVYTAPTVFLNNWKYEFINGKWEFDNQDITNFNQFLIKIPTDNIDETEKYENIVLVPEKQELERFINLLWPDPEIREWALANYATAFMPQSFEKIIFNYGQGRDGKSTVATLLSNILKHLSSSFYLNDNDKFAMANFPGKTLMVDNDFDANQTLTLDVIKHKTTKGSVEVENKNKDKKTIYNRTTLMVNSNFLPKFNDISNATERRLNIVLFENSMETNPDDDWFTLSETEELLQNKNFQYLFVVRCLQAFANLYNEQNGEIRKPKKIEEITKEVCEKNNMIYSFLYQKDIVASLKTWGELNLTTLYDTYSLWCCENSIQQKQAKRNFNQSVQIVLLNKFKIRTNKIEIKKHDVFEVKLIDIDFKPVAEAKTETNKIEENKELVLNEVK